ncbi:MAG: hypothetical protein LT106_03825 [Burkholderiaceae bacterium]|nr:hypothetical protein [Burkholderiaceae bacterium]
MDAACGGRGAAGDKTVAAPDELAAAAGVDPFDAAQPTRAVAIASALASRAATAAPRSAAP